ncbi:MAG: hypothetical protein AAGG48_03205 [Planctomycetota bacterium]
MRLTLRTLLAYLDNTLEPQDAAALRQKLSESGFATQLVQRIQGSLSESLPAPSPEAVGPVEDANVISEYLDSTLPSEQVAEIERACLESGPHLAEAAACHQILTMVLGDSAEVSEQLRKRIYELPERDINDIATAPSFSGLSIPVDRPSPLDIPPDQIATAAPTSTPVSEPVTPVGVNDSGVSDAPTRLREAEAVAAAMGRPERKVAIAGSKTQLNETAIYGGAFRPSRIAPWLVSLGLVAALAFAMVRIFEPLWTAQEVAEQETSSIIDTDTGTNDVDSVSDSDTEVAEEASTEDESNTSRDPDEQNASDDSETDDVESVSPPAPMIMSAPGTEPTEVTETEEATLDDATESVAVEAENMEADNVDSVAPPIPATAGNEEPTDNEVAMDDAESATPPIPPPVDDVAAEELADDKEPKTVLVGSLVSESTLVAAKVGDAWEHVKKDDDIPAGIWLFVAPTFRAEFATEKAGITFVGPSLAGWDSSVPDEPVLEIEMGRLIIKSTGFDEITMRLGSVPVSIKFADDESVIALTLQHYRAPGLDPLLTENRRLMAGAQVLQGSVEISHDGMKSNLVTGQQWTKKGAADPQVNAIEAIPAWATNDAEGLEKEAQEGLMALIEDAEPLEMELREARLFRRAEVGALAARTLLHMGLGDVYFGGDGILSDAKQRSYWLTHFNELQSVVNRSEASALNLRAAIVKMDSANALPLFRLLIGFSQTQLVEGGDEELVQLLDSPSMAVRVLALENLEAITGTTLYFRPEQENAVRREPGIKKWTVRQRKGDIRWQE